MIGAIGDEKRGRWVTAVVLTPLAVALLVASMSTRLRRDRFAAERASARVGGPLDGGSKAGGVLGDLRVSLARRRAEALLAELRARPSRRQQLEALMAAPCMYGWPVGWTGGAFDLEILLEDPTYTLPRRTRRSSEQMVGDAKAYVLRNSGRR